MEVIEVVAVTVILRDSDCSRVAVGNRVTRRGCNGCCSVDDTGSARKALAEKIPNLSPREVRQPVHKAGPRSF